MKRLLRYLMLVLLLSSFALGQGGQSTPVRNGASLPSGASQWSVFNLTSGLVGLYVCTNSPTCTSASQWSFIGPSVGMGGRQVTSGTYDALLASDATHFVVYSDGSTAVAVTVAQAGTTGFGNNYTVPLINTGTANVTLTTTTSTFNGSGQTAIVYPSTACTLNTLDNANWLLRCVPLLSAGQISHAQLPTLVSGDIPNNGANTTGNAATATALSTNGTANQIWVTNGTGTAQGWATVTSSTLVGTASDVTGQSTSQSAVTLASSGTPGNYRIKLYADLNTPCTTGSNTVLFTLSWTDGSNARTATIGPLTLGAAQSSSSFVEGELSIYAGGGSVTYSSTVSGTCTTGTSTYDVHASLRTP